MDKTSYQAPEIRNSSDAVIQEGAYGKNTAFCNAQNTGILDYINNNLEALHSAQTTDNGDIATLKSQMTTAQGNITSLSTNKVDLSTYNTKMGELDESITELSDGKLSLTGGTMTGAITLSNNTIALKQSSISSYIELRGSTSYNNGAYLRLNGKNESTQAGEFRIIAHNGTDYNTLIGKPSGELTWAGKNIVTEKNHYYIQCSASSTITIDYSSYNACVVRYARGTNTNGIILFDTWAGVGYISQTSSNKPTISMSTKKITFTNNYSSGAVSICVDMY